jgi:L-lactate permease
MQTLWQQNYDPAGNIWLSALVALIPIVFFFLALTKLRLKGYQAGTVTVLLALGVALLFYKMPVSAALASAVYGFFYGLWPIAWIIVAAVFLYKLSVKTGQFDVIRSSILSVTHDQRLQLILVGFCFGAFLEGRLWPPITAALLRAWLTAVCRRPVPDRHHRPRGLGAMGIPIIVAGQVSGLIRSSLADGRAPVALHDHPGAVLDHGHHGRPRREGDLACRAGGWRLVRRDPVPHRQLHRP